MYHNTMKRYKKNVVGDENKNSSYRKGEVEESRAL